MFGQKSENKKFKCSQLLEGDGIESRLPFKIFSTYFTAKKHTDTKKEKKYLLYDPEVSLEPTT